MMHLFAVPDIFARPLPGDLGKAVHVPKQREAECKEKFKINQFNLCVSEMIALNRTLPDVRMDGFVAIFIAIRCMGSFVLHTIWGKVKRGVQGDFFEGVDFVFIV